MPKPERTAAILVAAGRGLRAGSGGPKQYRSIGGQTVIFRAMEPFCRHPQIFAVQPVLNPDDTAMLQRRRQRRCAMSRPPMAARPARPRCMPDLKRSPAQKPDIVLIHDAARPFVTAALISRAIDAAPSPAPRSRRSPVTDTIKLVGDDRKRRSDAGARAAAHRADAAGIPVRRDSRRPSPRGARGPQRFHR